MSSAASADEDDVADFVMQESEREPCSRRQQRTNAASTCADAPSSHTYLAGPKDLQDGILRDADGLAVQDLAKLNLDKLAVDSMEVMSRQATVNVGTIGHVAHGKSTVVKALSGVKTQKYHREAVMNITIHLGYANAKVFQCSKCPRPSCFQTYPSSQSDATPCPTCGELMTLRRHFSFVDCPGHDVLMATMLNGAAIMDAALLLIAANESFPQPQTLEHLAAAEMMKVGSLIVVQNKMDLAKPALASAQYDVIKKYLAAKTRYGEAAVVPMCAQLGLNVPYLLDYLVHIPLPKRDLACPNALLHVLRSFDVSRPGELWLPDAHHRRQPHAHATVQEKALTSESSRTAGGLSARVTTSVGNPEEQDTHQSGSDDMPLTLSASPSTEATATQEALAQWLPGGVVGGTVERGVLCCGDEIEFLPGMLCLTSRDGRRRPSKVAVLRGETLAYLSAPPPGELFCVPIRTSVETLKAERNQLQYALPGGLVAVGTRLDPSLTRQSKLRGQVMRVVRSRLPYLSSQHSEPRDTRRGGAEGTANGGPPASSPWRVYQEVDIQFYLLKELLGLSRADLKHAEKVRSGGIAQVDAYRVHPAHTQALHTRVKPFREGDSIILNVGTLSTAATVTQTLRGAGRALVRLESPVCAEPGEKVVLARYVEKKVRLIGWGVIKRGVPVPVLE